MSDIYVPELIELDSYWQKAVEDAIYDTLKGEKRLYYALRNKKKIKDKLENLGLKVARSRMSSRRASPSSIQSILSNVENVHFEGYVSVSDTEWDSCEEHSTTSNKDVPNDAGVQEPGRASFSPAASKSKSRDRKETPPEKMYRNPERPILGNGSLEKMKKSQNSFYCEPMGTEGSMTLRRQKQQQQQQNKQEEELMEATSGIALADDERKHVECLHYRGRNGKASEDSITEISAKRLNENTYQHQKPGRSSLKRMSVSDTSNQSLSDTVQLAAEKIPMTLDPGGDLFWEKEVKNAIRENAGQERKLFFALAKRDIVKRLFKGRKQGSEIKIKVSKAKLAARRRQSKKFLSPFIKFYLEVYRELCHKCPIKEIGAEAAARWWQKSLKQKSRVHK